jgi:hypothetical protein
MKTEQLNRLAALLATKDNQPTIKHIRFFKGRGYWLGDEYLGNNRNAAFEALVTKIEERMKWEIRDMPQSAVPTRRGRAGVGD